MALSVKVLAGSPFASGRTFLLGVPALNLPGNDFKLREKECII